MTSQGHPRTAFRRALEYGNLLVAQATAREVGRIDLREALELTALIAKHDPRARGRRAGARWLRRWLEENPAATIDDPVSVAGLRSPRSAGSLSATKRLVSSRAASLAGSAGLTIVGISLRRG